MNGRHGKTLALVFVKPETCRKAAIAAQLSGKSLNQWAEDVFEAATKKLGTS